MVGAGSVRVPVVRRQNIGATNHQGVSCMARSVFLSRRRSGDPCLHVVVADASLCRARNLAQGRRDAIRLAYALDCPVNVACPEVDLASSPCVRYLCRRTLSTDESSMSSIPALIVVRHRGTRISVGIQFGAMHVKIAHREGKTWWPASESSRPDSGNILRCHPGFVRACAKIAIKAPSPLDKFWRLIHDQSHLRPVTVR